MQNILNLCKTNKLILAVFAFLAVLTLGTGRAHAATLNVTGGCTLAVAIDSVNAGANQSGCTATGAGYGTDDTITIPAGSYMLTADLPQITEPIVISGAGMSQTTINGDAGQYQAFRANTDATIRDLKVTAISSIGINIYNGDAVLMNIEIDGQDSIANTAIEYTANTDVSQTIDAENIYIHNFDPSDGDYFQGFWIESKENTPVLANLRNITLADIHNATSGVNGIIVVATGDAASMTANITNTTVHDITSGDLTAPFASFGQVNGGHASITTNVNNITITGTRGVAGSGFTAGLKTAAFYAAGASFGASDTLDVDVTVSNSLMADNLNDGVPSNCSFGDMTDNVGGQGTVTTSITSAGYNISDDASCAGFNQTGDRQNINNIISTLGPLQNNGGSVPTRALLTGSPAINTGSTVLGVTTDARGMARPTTCPSVGAFQFEGAVCAATTTNANAGGAAAAPSTGVKPSASLVQITVSLLGIGSLAYAIRGSIHREG